MKIAIVTALHGRADISRVVLGYYSTLQLTGQYNLSLMAVTSTRADAIIASGCGWEVVHHNNDPLSQKFNAVTPAARVHNPDAVLLIGSDDLLDRRILDHYLKVYSPDARHMLGLIDLFFYRVDDRKAIYFPGYREAPDRSAASARKTIGAGRIFSRWVMEKVGWRPWGDASLNRGLDTASSIVLRKAGVQEQAITMTEAGGILVDLKYRRENLTDYRFLQARSVEIDATKIAMVFPHEFIALNEMAGPIPPKFKRRRIL